MGTHAPQHECHPGHYNLGPRFLPPLIAYRIDRAAVRVGWRLKRLGGLSLYRLCYLALYRFEYREFRP